MIDTIYVVAALNMRRWCTNRYAFMPRQFVFDNKFNADRDMAHCEKFLSGWWRSILSAGCDCEFAILQPTAMVRIVRFNVLMLPNGVALNGLQRSFRP